MNFLVSFRSVQMKIVPPHILLHLLAEDKALSVVHLLRLLLLVLRLGALRHLSARILLLLFVQLALRLKHLQLFGHIPVNF